MASALERRFDIARSALGRRAQEQSLAEQEALRQKFATQGSLESGAAIKGAVAQEEALARKATQAGSDIARAEAQAGQALEETKAGREFAVGEAKAGRSFASGEAAAGREFAGSEKALDRAIDQRKIKIAQDELALNEQISLSNLRRQQEAAAQPKPASTIDKLITGQMGTELIERLIGRPLTDKEKLWLPQHQLLGTDLETLDPRKARIKLGFPTF
jgi:hypothetical protein